MAFGMPVDPIELLRAGDRLSKDRDSDVRILFVVEPDAAEPLLDAVQELFKPLTTSAQVDVRVASDVVEGVAIIVPDVAVLLLGSGATGSRASIEALRRIAVPVVGIMLGEERSIRETSVATAAGLSTADVFAGDEPVTLIRDSLAPWIVDHTADVRLALASNFPVLRRAIAAHAVRTTALQNAVIGGVAFLPGADMPLMTANQAKMLLQIAAAYGEPLGAERMRELAAVIGGAFLLRTVARQAVTLLPGFGWAIKAAIGYTGTMAMGKAAAEYFEDGGDIFTVVAWLQMRSGEIAADAKARLEAGEGTDLVARARGLMPARDDSAAHYTTVPAADPATGAAPALLSSYHAGVAPVETSGTSG